MTLDYQAAERAARDQVQKQKSGNGRPNEPRRPPAIMTSAELLSYDFPEPRFVVPDLLCEGLSILAGKPKLGKSWLTFDWALAISGSGRALGKLPCEGGNVLLLALEDSQRRMQNRLRMLGATGSDQLTVAVGWPRIDEGGFDQICTWLDRHPDCRMMVIDTLARIRQRTRSRDAYQADADSLEQLQVLAGERHIAIVVVHHTRKASADDWLDAVSGTAGLTGAADSVLVLKRDRGQADAFLFGTGRDLPDFEKPLKFDESTCQWSLLDVSAAEAHATSDQAAIIALMRSMQGAGLLRSQIARALDRSKTAVSNMLARMEDAGIVERDNNLWRLTV